MGTRGILYIYYSDNEGGRTQVFYIQCDSMEVLLEVRRKFLRLKTAMGFKRLIDSLKTDRCFELLPEVPHDLEASECWPFLIYSLEVRVRGIFEDSTFQVLVDLVQRTISESEFKPVKGQRRQDRRSPKEKVADRERKLSLQRQRQKMIEWGDDGIHGHELCLQREWAAEIARIDDEIRKSQLRRLIEESKARLPQRLETRANAPRSELAPWIVN